MGKRENKVEKYLKKRCEEIGALCEKWGLNGNPDRVVSYKSKIHLVEVKTVDGKPTLQQKVKKTQYSTTGVDINFLYGEIDVDLFIFNLINE